MALNISQDVIRRNPALQFPDPKKSITVTVVASDTAMGGALLQMTNGIKTPVDFFPTECQ